VVNGAAIDGSLARSTATGIAIMLFVGAVGKSAQLPLYLWLPDAMEGPTPVSALIHAATMVTAGVFLMVRMNPVLSVAADWVPTTIAWIGVITALFAATIAIAQNDIKKVLAYSTVSQLGYMFLAVGSGAYVAAIFHMVTHAFFKALLFLGSGSVIHGMHDEQDMRRMGRLRALLPVTAFTFIVGWLAIAGVPPFSGFWSKDEILLFSLAKSPALYLIGLFTALLTAYYMTRQVIMVFFGEATWQDRAAEHGAHGDLLAAPADQPERDDDETAHSTPPHESPPIMLGPLVVLAGLSIVGGLMQLPFSHAMMRLGRWLHPVVEPAEGIGEVNISGTWADDNKYLLMAIAIVIALAGIVIAYFVYQRHRLKAVEPAVLANGWYYDETVTAFMGGPGYEAFEDTAWFDRNVVDGAVDGTGRLVRLAAGVLRRAQSGYVRAYAAIIGLGAALVLAWFVVRGFL
jgi:NADH-quinone oxidoreductase subunit L